MNCPGCGTSIPDAYAGVRCPSCNSPLFAAPTTPPATDAGAGSPGSEGIPWENREVLGFFPALLATLRDCLFEPAALFSRMPKRKNLGSAIGYAVLLGWAGTIGAVIWNILLSGAQTSVLRRLGIEPPAETVNTAQMERFLGIGFAIFAPLFLLLVLFIWSGILHLCLLIVGGAKEGFEATARVYAYVMGSTALFQWIPLCGGIVAFFWSLVVQIIGLSRAHGISGGRAAFAVLLPITLCCVCLGILMAMFLGTLMGLAGRGGP